MQPLTHQVWTKHFVALRPHVLEEFPEVDSMELQTVGDDWDGLVELVHNSTGMSADLAVARLRKLDVDELGLGTGGDGQDDDAGRATLAGSLRLGPGLSDERDEIVERLSKLDRRLARFPADGTDLLLTVKERDSSSQQRTLEGWLPRYGKILATSREPDFRDGLMDVREDLWRQIDDAVTKRVEGSR